MEIFESIIHFIDHISSASDRWLFIAVLVIFFAAGYITVRWLVKYFTDRVSKLEDEVKEIREKFLGYVQNESAKTSALLERCLSTLDQIERQWLK